jgi:hypothetical protein
MRMTRLSVFTASLLGCFSSPLCAADEKIVADRIDQLMKDYKEYLL